MKNNSGQAMLEAVFTIIFITVIMFAFLQICIIVVDDMTANEAAFSAMRSAAVTKSKIRADEAEQWGKKYLRIFYPFASFDGGGRLSSFSFSDKNTVEKYLLGNQSEESLDSGESAADNSDRAVTLWSGDKKTKDYSGKSLTKQTVKIYYFTRVMFGKLTAPSNSKKYFLETGARRYQSSRSRMFPSPDEEFYYKAYPDGEKFKDYALEYN
jgi:hypothetical protein